MPNAGALQVTRFIAMLMVAALVCGTPVARGESSLDSILPGGLLPLLNGQPPANAVSTADYQEPTNMPRRAPMARLIENPDQTDGAPPFALTDQTGMIQRYVEPVPGIDLSTHVGQVVTVRNDTGPTLLASQLDLPPEALRPMAGNPDDRYASATAASGIWRSAAEPPGSVQQVQYVDNDDASVQLLPDGGSAVDPSGMGRGGLMPLDGMPSTGQFPPYGDQIGPPGMAGPMCPPNMPMQYPPGVLGYPTGENQEQADRAQLSADIELSLLRPQVAESAAGRFSEEYQFSPRVILGLRGLGNLEGRVRYWHYNRNSDDLGTSDDIRLKFNVLDVEALHRFEGRRSEFALAAGVRFAGIRLTDFDDHRVGTDLFGLTLAGDGLSRLGMFPGGHVGLVYGGRLSILGGDWHGDMGNTFLTTPAHNDNVLVHELYGGIELARRFRAIDCHARLVYEMQNWQSDVLAENSGFESIGFFGPGLELGADF
jgi:hypothetical protein